MVPSSSLPSDAGPSAAFRSGSRRPLQGMPPLSLQEDFPETKERRAVSSKALPPHGFFRSFHSSGGAHSSPTRLFRQGFLQSPPYPPHRKSSGSLPARPPLLSEPPPRSWEERHFWNPGLLPFRKAAFRRESDILPPVLSHPASLFTVCITLPFCSRSAALFRLFNRCPSRPTGQAPSRRAETTRRCRRN